MDSTGDYIIPSLYLKSFNENEMTKSFLENYLKHFYKISSIELEYNSCCYFDPKSNVDIRVMFDLCNNRAFQDMANLFPAGLLDYAGIDKSRRFIDIPLTDKETSIMEILSSDLSELDGLNFAPDILDGLGWGIVITYANDEEIYFGGNWSSDSQQLPKTVKKILKYLGVNKKY